MSDEQIKKIQFYELPITKKSHFLKTPNSIFREKKTRIVYLFTLNNGPQ